MFKFDITIRSKLNYLLGFIISILVIIGIFTYASINRIISYTNYLENFRGLKIKYLQLRDYENTFLLTYHTDNEFFQKGTSITVEKHTELFNEIISSVNSLSVHRLAEKFEINTLLNRISEYNEKYGQFYKQLVAKFKERGFTEFGEIGEMRKSIHAAESSTKDMQTLNFILQLRRSEKDFLLRNELIYAEKFASIYNEVKGSLNRDSANQVVGDYIKSYFNSFQKVVFITKEIGLNDKEGLRANLKNEITKIDPIVEKINLSIYQEIYDTKQRTIVAVLLLILFLIVSISIAMHKVFATIMWPIDTLKSFITQLGKGMLPKEFIKFHNKDEISEMGDEIKKLIEGLRSTTNFAISIGQGKLDSEFNPLSKEDMLGNSLLEMRENLVTSAKEIEGRKIEDDKQNWATAGLAQMGDILRKDNDNIEQLSYNIISQLIKYVDANQGLIFILNDDNKDDVYFDLKATFAFDRKKFKKGKMYPGDGIAGRCALEGETVYMVEVPDDYVEISSGIGRSRPRSILIVPLKVNSIVYGVMEMASFKNFEKHQITFVEKVAETVASTISSVRINLQTARLLQESKIIAEELASKEEEMRQNMEELQATQEEAARKEAEASGFVNAVNHSIIRADFGNDGSLAYANTKFLKVMGYKMSEIQGQKIWTFVNAADYEDFKEQWERVLSGGKHIEQELRLKTSSGNHWFLVTFTPIRDFDGNVIKILYLAIDIDSQKAKNIDFQEEINALNKSVIKSEYSNDGKIKTVNEVFLSIFGYNREELKNQSIYSLIPKDKLYEFENIWKKLTMGVSYQGDLQFLNKTGELISLNTTLTAVRNYDNELYKIVFIAYDITNQKNGEEENKRLLKEARLMAEEMERQQRELKFNIEEMTAVQEEMALKEREISAKMFAINLTNAMAEYATDGTIINANEMFCDLTGYTQNDLMGRNNRILFDSEYRKSFEYNNIWENLRKGISQEGEYKFLTKDNRFIYLRTVFNPIQDFDGNTEKVLQLSVDITENKKRQAEISGQLEVINKTTANIEMKLDGTIIKVNDLICELFEYTEEELIGKNQKVLFDEKIRKSDQYREMWLNVRNGIPHKMSGSRIAKSGNEIFVSSSLFPMLDENGMVNKVVELIVDLTSFQEQQEILKIQAKELEESEQKIKIALEESQTKEQELKLKSEELISSEEELRQNMEELQATQDEMLRKQNELNKAKEKLESNEAILIKAVQKQSENEKLMKQQAENLKVNEEELRKNLEKLEAVKEDLLRKQNEIEEIRKLEAEKFEAQIKALTEEANQKIIDLQKNILEKEEEIIRLKNSKK